MDVMKPKREDIQAVFDEDTAASTTSKSARYLDCTRCGFIA